MDAVAIIDRCQAQQVELIPDGNDLIVRSPEPLEADLLADLRAHKKEVISFLKLSEHSPIQSKPRVVEGPKEWQAEQVAQCVEKEGVCIFWSQLFREAVAFIKAESYRSNVPGDIVTYTSQEIRKLFPHNGGCPSNETLWLIHEAKKLGGHVIEG